MNEEIDTENITRDEAKFTVDILPKAVKMGLLFVIEESEDQFSFLAPEELHDIFKKLDEVREKSQEKMTFVRDLEDVLRAGVHLYGIISTDQLLKLWEIKYSNDDYTLDYNADVRAMISLITIKHDYHFVDNLLIASDRF